MKTITSLSKLFTTLSFLVICAVDTTAQICNPDNVPPTFKDPCPTDTVFTMLAPTDCSMLVNWIPPTASDLCVRTNLLATPGADFFTYYDGVPGSQGTGTVIHHGTDSVTIIGTSNGLPTVSRVINYCFYATCSGTLSFTYRARMSNGDGFNLDRARLMLENKLTGVSTTTILTTGNGNFFQGAQSVTVGYGDRVCFEVQSDNVLGVDSLTISNLNMTTAGLTVSQIRGPRPGDLLEPGLYGVNYLTTDCAGNYASCNFTVTVVPAPEHLLSNCSNDTTILLDDPTNCDTLLTGLIPIVNNYCPQYFGLLGAFYPSANLATLPADVNFPYLEKVGPLNDFQTGTDGRAIVDAAGVLSLVGTNNGTIPDGFTGKSDTSVIYACSAIPCAGEITFDYSATMVGGGAFRWDEAGAILYDLGTLTQVDDVFAMPPFANLVTGSRTYTLSDGGYICFYVRSDNRAFEDSLAISNFIFTPDPAVLVQTCGPDLTIPVGPGIYDLCYETRDCFGNLETCNFQLTVKNDFTLGCKDINVSLDSLCTATITPAMLVAGPSCTATMIVDLSAYGKPISNPVDTHWLNKKIIGKVTDTLTGNSCWSNILIEDKLAPSILCGSDTIDCYRFAHDLPLIYNGYDCSKYTVTATGDITEHLDCDEDYLKRVYRNIKITDDLGNETECQDTILVERITADDIILPNEDFVVYCSDEYELDENNHPAPTNRGFPYFLSEGQIIFVTYPTQLIECHLWVGYSDLDLGEIGCVRKIMRTWTVREWWCNTEITRTSLQVIIIHDNAGPVITHSPYDFNATTAHKGCYANLNLPAIEATDLCHDIFRYDVIYPGGSLINKNGGLAQLPVGVDTVYYRAYDKCYNVTEDTLIVTVADDTEPIAVCDRRTVVSINLAGYNWIPAEVFDDGSFDECGLHHFEVRRMDRDACGVLGEDDWGPEVGFCCADVGRTIMVALRVIDKAGNEAICMVSVEVQDKNQPKIKCPPHIDIDCRFGIDLDHLGNSFGRVALEESTRDTIVIDPRYWHEIYGHPFDGVAYDNCGLTITEELDTSGMNQCGMGLIIRKFIARDQQGARDSCYQHIRIDNHFPMSELSIDWPDDYEASNICDSRMLRPELLSAPYNVPTFVDDECSLVGMDYEDHIFSSTVPGEPCYKILREWKIIDWCYRDRLQNIVIFRDTQIIKVSNTIDPVITRACRDTTICSYDVECRPIPVTLSIAAQDFCTLTSELLYRYKIDLNSDGTFDINVAQVGNPVATGTWPLGRHIIKWEVEDRCGNTAVCQSQLNLLNCKPPTAYSHKDLAIGLTAMDTNGDGQADTKMAIVWASDLDAGSNHNCGYPLKYSFSRDTNDIRRVYTCDSIGPRNVELWVTDPNGNSSFVKTIIIINDNPQQDPRCPGRANVSVSGLIHSPENGMVEYVDVNLDNSQLLPSKTNYEGQYSFPGMPTGGTYTIRPYLNEEWLNGISTADIVKIQKHILGKDLLTSAYQMIAADVNKSGTVTSADIAELRKLILGTVQTIDKNTSWRFVLEQYSFASVENALKELFPEQYEIGNLNNDVVTNFIGIKIGDLNNNAKTRGLSNSIQTRSSKVMDLAVENVNLVKDEITEINFVSENIQELQGFQFTIEIDPTIAQIIEVQGIREAGIFEDHFNLSQIHHGIITMSWNGTVSSNNSKLFTIKLRSILNARPSDMIRITSSLTPSLCVDKLGEEGKVQFRTFNGLVDEMIVLQNEPNPWKNTTSIGIILPQAGEVQLTIYDLSGKVLYTESKGLQKSYNEWIVNRSQLPSAGIYYYQVDYSTQTKTNKMVLIE